MSNEEGQAEQSELSREEILALHRSDLEELAVEVQKLVERGIIPADNVVTINELWEIATADRYTPQMKSVNGPKIFTQALVNLKPTGDDDEQRSRIIGALPDELKDVFVKCAVDEVMLIPISERNSLPITLSKRVE